jgi:hypothetical protein
MRTDKEIQDIIDGTYKMKVGDSFTLGNSKKGHKIISETNKFFVIDTCFDGCDKNIRVRKSDGRVMGGCLYGQFYLGGFN